MRIPAIFSSFDSSPRGMEAPSALSLVAFIVLCVFQGYALYLKQPFDVQGFGIALGSILCGGGVASYGQGYVIRSRMTEQGTMNVDNPDG